MNRKKTIDYTVTRRPRDSYCQLNASKPGTDNRDQRGRGNGDRDKKPFWSRDEENLGSQSKYNPFQMADRDAVLKDLQEEISRAALSQGDRGGLRGPIIDEFSEDAYDLRGGSKSERMDFRDTFKDQQYRKSDDSFARKRSYSPRDEKSSSYRKRREDTPTKHGRNTNSSRSHSNDDDDLRNVLQQHQKSKWDDDNDTSKGRKRYDSKDSGGNHDRKRSKDSLGVSSSSDMFTMSSQGTLVSLPLEPRSDNRDYFDTGFSTDYRDKGQQKGDKQTYGESGKDRDSRDSRDYSSSRYNFSRQDRRGSLDGELRGLSSDLDKRDSRYRVDSRDSVNEAEIGDLLHQYRDSTQFEGSSLRSDTLRDLSLTELAEKAGEKYRSGFELGRPFFGLAKDNQGKEQGWQDPKFVGEPKQDSIWSAPADLLTDQRDQSFRDIFGNDDFSVQQGGKEMIKDRLGSKLLSGQLTKSKLPGSSSSKSSTLNTPKTGAKPLFPLGFMPRQVKVPVGKNSQTAGVNKGNESPPLLPRKKGYFPRNTDITSRSRSRSSERGDDLSGLGSNSSSRREVKPPSKGKFTNQNWSGLESNNIREESKQKDTLKIPPLMGSTRGRGNNNRGNRGRGGNQQRGRGNANNRGRGAGLLQGGRGGNVRGRGNRGRGFTPRGRGFVPRGRGRGISQPGTSPVGATVRNIFRRSRTRSPAEGKHRKSSRSPGSPSRGRSRRRRGSRSRSRSSSYCSTCSCSTCHSWRSISVDSLSGKGDKEKKKHDHHKRKMSTKEETEKKSTKVDKLKADIKDMEKKLEQKNVKDVTVKRPTGKNVKDTSVKRPPEKNFKDTTVKKPAGKDVKAAAVKKPTGKDAKDITVKKPAEKDVKDITVKRPSDKISEQKSSKAMPKGKLDPKSTKDVSRTDIKDEKKGGKFKDWKGSSKDVVVKDEKSRSPFEDKKEFKKAGNFREVVLKSERRKESPLVIKKEKESPAREVKIVSEQMKRGDRSLDEKTGSKMKIDSLKITIDQPERVSDLTKKKKIEKEDERRVDEGKKSSKSPPGKQKKKDKEKVKSKKAKKKSKKRKYGRDSGDSGDESVYSSISGQDEYFTNYDEKSKDLHYPNDERIVEFSSGAYDSNKITVHYAKRNNSDSNHANSRKLSEGEGSKNAQTRKNLITIPLPKEPDLFPRGGFPQNARGAPLPQQGRLDYLLSKVEQDGDSSDAPYSEISYTENDPNVDWETAKFAGEFHTGNVHGEQDYGSTYQGSEDAGQEWAQGQEEVGGSYYQEGAEGEGYEQGYESYPQEDVWQSGDQAQGEYQEGEYQEWYEGEYSQEGVEGEAGAEYDGQYYLGEDGLYYPVEGEGYEQYQGEYVEGGEEGEVVDPEQGAACVEEGDGYQYAEEGAEWQQYEEGAAYHTEEGWGQGEVEGQWEEYQEGYPGAESGWGSTEYSQGNEFEAARQEYAAEGVAALPQEGYSTGEGQGYNEQLAQDQYYAETYPPEEGQYAEQGFEPQQQEEVMEPVYNQEPLTLNNNAKTVPDVARKENTADARPLKSILKKANQAEGKGTKLVSERLAHLRNQPTSRSETSSVGSSLGSSPKSFEKTEQNPGQEASAKSESERYREMEEAILCSQPKDAIGTEYVVRVHESGTANFFCKLCKCYFNTLTAKNLHIKGMKHIELYIRMKSSLLQSVIKDTKSETSKRPADEGPSGAQKVPRRF